MKKQKLYNLMNSVIRSSFPWMKDTKILIIRMNLGKYSAGVFWLVPNLRLVFINMNRLRGKNDAYLRGLFAHELAHFERSKNLGWINYLGYYFLHLFSSKIRAGEEKETDKLAIRKGYGRNLYGVTLCRALEKRRFYLSADEIKEYAKKLGKW